MKRLLVLAVTALIGGCGGSLFTSKEPVSEVYVLTAVPQGEISSTPVQADIALARPTAAPGLETEHIAVLRNTRQLDFYAAALWGDTATRVVQALFVTSLQNLGRFRSVTSEQARVASDYVIDLELQDFQAEYANGTSTPNVHVGVAASLLRLKDRKLIANWRMSATVPVAENRLSAVVAAFEAASQQVATELSAHTAGLILE